VDIATQVSIAFPEVAMGTPRRVEGIGTGTSKRVASFATVRIFLAAKTINRTALTELASLASEAAVAATLTVLSHSQVPWVCSSIGFALLVQYLLLSVLHIKVHQVTEIRPWLVKVDVRRELWRIGDVLLPTQPAWLLLNVVFTFEIDKSSTAASFDAVELIEVCEISFVLKLL
jgi:hypothetical protein